MKHLSFSRALPFLCGALAAFTPGLPSASARDAKSGNKSPAAEQAPNPPLRLKFDGQPIDRSAPDRVSYAPMIEKSSQSVVFVYSTKQVRPQEVAPYLDDPVLRRFFGVPGGPGIPGGPGVPGAPGGRGGPGLGGRMPEQTQRGLGSGVIVSADGYILTNNHVVDGADEVKVSIGESLKRYDATVVGADPLADLAVLKIEAEGAVPATFGDSEQLKPGDVVLAIGNPFGVGLSVSRGIVSAVSRGVGIEQIEDFIQTDAAINMGNSGGALIDSAGRVVGINTAILSRSGGFAGVGFAIPSNLARNIADQIVRTGEVTRGFLGVAPQPLTAELANEFGAQRGALVAEVTPGSGAEKAGLRAGDVITRVNELDVTDPRQLLLTVSQLAPGMLVKINYLRDGEQHTANATLGRRPGEEVAGTDPGRKGGTDDGVLDGVGVTDITPQLREQLDIPQRVEGAIITQVDPASAAARQGLRPGDVILELDRKPVKNGDEAVRLSESISGPKVVVRIWREGQSRFMVIDESNG